MQGAAGLIPGWGAKNTHALWPKKKTKNPKQKQYCNKFNKDVQFGPHQKKKKKNLKKKKKHSLQVSSDQCRTVLTPPSSSMLSFCGGNPKWSRHLRLLAHTADFYSAPCAVTRLRLAARFLCALLQGSVQIQ